MLKINCPCGHVGEVDEVNAGKTATCVNCGNRVYVPRPNESTPKHIRRVREKIVGIWAADADMSRVEAVRAACAVYAPIVLQREPDNPYHAYAVAAYLPVPGVGLTKIGYLPMETAEDVYPDMPPHNRIEAFVIVYYPESLVRVEMNFYGKG